MNASGASRSSIDGVMGYKAWRAEWCGCVICSFVPSAPYILYLAAMRVGRPNVHQIDGVTGRQSTGVAASGLYPPNTNVTASAIYNVTIDGSGGGAAPVYPAPGDGSVEFQKNGAISEPLMEKSLNGAGEQIKSLWRFANIQLSR